MDENISLIKKVPLLNSISDEAIHTSLTNGSFKVVPYKKNSVLHFDGENCIKLEIILSGKVVIDRIDETSSLLTISEFIKNDILGGNLLFSIDPSYPMTVSAHQNTVILQIEKEVLFDLLCSNPLFLRSYLEVISEHASILGDKIKHYVNKSIRESILNYLNYERSKQNTNHIRLNISKKALSEKIGVQRTSISRELAKMRKDGLIVYDRDSITLLKHK